MKRPSDQAKLLFLGLLKTVSALATEPRGAVAAAAAATSSSWHHHHHHAWRRGVMTSTVAAAATLNTASIATPSLTATSWKTPQSQTSSSSSSSSSSSNNNNNLPPTLPPLTLRLAQRTDVPSMQRCNLATLPENYNGAFYVQHMRNWPELALVVVIEEDDKDDLRHHIGSNSGLSFSPFPTNTHLQQQDPPQQVVAYVLGKVEERTVERNVLPFEADDDHDEEDAGKYDWLHRRLSAAAAAATSQQQQQQQSIYETEHIGHITSLAVLQDYRRQGLAQALMEQLHVQLQRHYATAGQVGLHVRQSNKAATALYHGFGYVATECIPRYYQDGEDAYYMMKDLKQQQQRKNNENNNRNESTAASTASQQARGGGGGGGLFGQYWRQRQQAAAAAAEKRKQDDPWAMPRSVGRPPREEESEEQLMTGTF